MKYIKEHPILEYREDRIGKKINLLMDLSTDLTDIGLYVEVYKAPMNTGELVSDRFTKERLPLENFIVVRIQDYDSILDEDGYYENELKDKEEIKEFISKLDNYGMEYRSITWNQDKVWLYFDKQGKMTNSPLLEAKKKKILSTTPSDMVSTLEDISLELKDDGYGIKVTNKSPMRAKMYPMISVVINKIEDGRRSYLDIDKVSGCITRMVNFMESEGYRHWIFPGVSSTSHFVKVDNLDSIKRDFPDNKSHNIEIRFRR